MTAIITQLIRIGLQTQDNSPINFNTLVPNASQLAYGLAAEYFDVNASPRVFYVINKTMTGFDQISGTGGGGGITALSQASDYATAPLATANTSIAAVAATANAAIPASQKGANGGVATLTAGGQLTAAQIPTSILGAENYQGAWNASTNIPALASGVGTKGFYYTVSVQGTTALNGIASWFPGDKASYNGTAWEKFNGVQSEVISVGGQTPGAGGDVSIALANLSDGAVQAATIASKAPSASPSLTGPVTTSGVSVTTAPAITITTNAGVMDNTKGVETAINNADTTLTFNAPPGVANTWKQVVYTNSDATNPHTLTLPSAFSLVTQAARTTCVVAAGGQVMLTWRWDGSAYHIFGDSAYVSNFAATTNPVVGSDVTQGYGPGSLWGNVTAGTLYYCKTNAVGAAAWAGPFSTSGTGTVTNTGGALTANALVLGAGTNDTKVVAGITTNGAGQLNLGVAGTTVGSIQFANATSGTITQGPPTGALGTITQTMPVANGQQGMAGAQFLPITASYTTLAADHIPGRTIRHNGAGVAHTLTIDGALTWGVTNEASMFGVSNPAGQGVLSIALTGGATLAWSKAAGGTGARSMAAGAEAMITWVGGTAFEIVGNDGLS